MKPILIIQRGNYSDQEIDTIKNLGFNVIESPDPSKEVVHNGRTLRDWFAGMALQGWVAKHGANSNEEEAAFACYGYSDKMLVQRDL